MIITRTPFRISFVGGGSDMEEFYARFPGAVLSVTINKFMYISSHYFFDTAKIRVKYAQTETVTSVDELRHPIVREILKKFQVGGALEISSNADVPSGTGLGSSSAFAVGLLHNMHIRSGQYMDKGVMAEEACDIEINRLKEPIGKQDQYASAFGGLNIFRFDTTGDVNVEHLHLPRDRYKTLQKNLLMFYTGAQRKASEILAQEKENLASREKTFVLRKMVALVDVLRDVLYKGELADFGRVLHENWMLKKELAAGISTPEIDEFYRKGTSNGALGGKLLGAGRGGFLLFYCEEENQEKLRRALAPLVELKFKLENEGTKLIYAGDEYQTV